MDVSRNSRIKEVKPVVAKTSSSSFESITQQFLSSSRSNQIKCPSCGNIIDFNKGVLWEGPDTFTCNGCNRFLSMRLIQRALKDLGVEQ